MSQLMPSDIKEEVRSILAAARTGKGRRPNFLTSFQILARLSASTRDRLIAERVGTGKGFGPASVVSRAAQSIPGVVVEYMDCVGLSVDVDGNSVVPSYEVCGIFRLETVDEDVE